MRTPTILLRLIFASLFYFLFSANVAAQNKKNVLIIGIDGLRGDALMAAPTPNIDKFMNQGEYSFDADMGVKTNCAAGWSNILTGVWHKKHRVKDKTFKKAMLTEYPHFFSLLTNNIKTASVINLEMITSNIDCCSKIMLNSSNDIAVTKKSINLISSNQSDLIIVNFHELDEIGHLEGFNARSTEYLDQIVKLDKMFADILESVKTNAKKTGEEWMVIITTDHGGDAEGSDGLQKLQQVRYAPQIMAFVSPTGDIRYEMADNGLNMRDASSVNIVPTVLDYFNITKPAYLDGQSYLVPR